MFDFGLESKLGKLEPFISRRSGLNRTGPDRHQRGPARPNHDLTAKVGKPNDSVDCRGSKEKDFGSLERRKDGISDVPATMIEDGPKLYANKPKKGRSPTSLPIISAFFLIRSSFFSIAVEIRILFAFQ